MGFATLAVTEVSHVPDQANEWGPDERPASERLASAEARARDCEVRVLTPPRLEPRTRWTGRTKRPAPMMWISMITEFDRLRGWEPEGHCSCAHWLAFRTGIDLGAAREKVRAARALTELPQISASMEQGELSFAKVRALTRVATPESEGDLLELAQCSTAAQLERTVRAWRRMCRFDENELEKIRHRSRCFLVFPDEEGMYVVRGRLDPEVGAMLMRAVDAASDALFKASIPKGGTPEDIEPRQRRADAVGLLAERALAVEFGCAERSGAAADGERTNAADIVPLSGTRAERYQVVLHVEASTLESEREPGRSELEDGTRVSAETSRRLSCDASVVRLTEAPDGKAHDDSASSGSVHDVGRKTRTIPPALRRALEARDRGCRFSGCGLRFTDAHHVRHWADGGETKLENLILLCRFHHRLVHEEGYTVHFPRGERPYFLDPRMRLLSDQPPPPPRLPPEPAKALVRQNRLRAVDPGFLTSAARCKREDDIPSAVFMRAFRALEGLAPVS